MPIKPLMIAVAMLGYSSPTAATPSHAAPAPAASYCGASLVASLALCITWEMRVAEYRALIRRADAGDRDAALTLAQFEDYRAFTNKGGPDGSKWWARAAQLGECQALRRLRDGAARIGNASVAAHWRSRIRHFRCATEVEGERWMGTGS